MNSEPVTQRNPTTRLSFVPELRSTRIYLRTTQTNTKAEPLIRQHFLSFSLYAMETNGSSTGVGEMESSLEKIKKQLTSASGRHLLQGPLLKRSETLRKWNERWVILDPTTGKMEYKIRRADVAIKGSIIFDYTTAITLSPLNFHGLPKYNGCCFYIGTPAKKEYFLCAETPGAARAWVDTLKATQLVLRAHKEAVNNIGGAGSAKLGTVSMAVATANATAVEASKEIEAALRISMQAALGLPSSSNNNNRSSDPPLDSLTIMKETLRVKDEEIQNLSKDVRARDLTIKQIAEKLTETASAAETAASAALSIDEERKKLCSEIELLKKDLSSKLESSLLKLKETEEKVVQLGKEKEFLLKQRDGALHEAQMWRSELAKAREQAVLLEAAIMRAEEKARVSSATAEARVREAEEKVEAASKERQELLALVSSLQSQLPRKESDTKQVCEEMVESCSGTVDTPLTKQVDLSEEDKACVSDSRPNPVSEDTIVQLTVDRVDIHSIGDSEWEGFGTDVREVSPESSLDIPVVGQPTNDH
ncbi:PH domain containing protein [Rhynchospora pubera]|uniref:PH domain containing protein n=1 Tax=Rhynchospora pubera TaxID=906938 RepID=A0AAV8G3G3_9POAL|nr:PH domain containing protein [Rhynchospora pubera]